MDEATKYTKHLIKFLKEEGFFIDMSFISPEIIEPIVSKKKNDAQSKKDQWKEFVNLSETNVKLVDNIEGQKVYHSTM